MTDKTLHPGQFTQLLESKENVPSELAKYVSLCIEQGQTNRLLLELTRDASATAQGLDRFFRRASQATGLSPTAVLGATGFSWRDLDPSRIESAIAQLRAIFFLDGQRFTELTLIPARKGRSSDTTAILREDKYAVEVFNSIYDASERFSGQELADWAFSRVESGGKKSQIAATSKEHFCTRGAFVAVISTQPTVALQTHPQFLEAARLTWEYIGSPSHLHVCMVTGRVALGYGPDDAFYPPWPTQ